MKTRKKNQPQDSKSDVTLHHDAVCRVKEQLYELELLGNSLRHVGLVRASNAIHLAVYEIHNQLGSLDQAFTSQLYGSFHAAQQASANVFSAVLAGIDLGKEHKAMQAEMEKPDGEKT